MAKQCIVNGIILMVFILNCQAQLASDAPLFMEMKKQDSLFFERGFNQCDIAYLENHISRDLKFYHDQSGFQDRTTFFENIKKYICANPHSKPIRKPDVETFTVFPLYENGVLYGAIHSGVHHFYLREEGKADVATSTARFTSVWIKEKEAWKLSEVLSYDHQDPHFEEIPVNTMEQLLKKNHVPALGLGVLKNGKLIKVEVYGTLDKENTAPYNTIFKVASLTKPIVAITALKLIDEGLLDLNEPLYPYWIDPDINHDERHKKLTPKLVLTHQTGFPNWRYMNESNTLAFQFDPGDNYQYSGEGFEYLRKAMENKLGRPIEELAQEYVFLPAGMRDTRFWWDASMDESRYAQNFNETGEAIPTEKYYKANAAANLLTTVEDYGNFISYVMNGAGLSESLFKEMQHHQVKLRDNDYFGLGWEILTGFSKDEYALLHTGKDPGVSTLAIFFPKSKNGYVIFLNGDNTTPVYNFLLTQKMYLGRELWNKK